MKVKQKKASIEVQENKIILRRPKCYQKIKKKSLFPLYKKLNGEYNVKIVDYCNPNIEENLFFLWSYYENLRMKMQNR